MLSILWILHNVQYITKIVINNSIKIPYLSLLEIPYLFFNLLFFINIVKHYCYYKKNNTCTKIFFFLLRSYLFIFKWPSIVYSATFWNETKSTDTFLFLRIKKYMEISYWKVATNMLLNKNLHFIICRSMLLKVKKK